MLTKYRSSNDLPQFAPFGLFELSSPWHAFGSLRQDLDRLFGAYERSLADPVANGQDSAEIRDTGNDVVISVDLPGVSKNDVELSVSGDNVFVRATRTATAPEGYTTHRRERVSYEFEHAWKLPVPVGDAKSGSQAAGRSPDRNVAQVAQRPA